MLSLDEAEWPDDLLHEHTDALVVLIGWSLLLIRQESSKARLQRLRRKLLNPTNKFLEALNNNDFSREYQQDRLPLSEVGRDALIEQVTAFKITVEGHIETIENSSRKGKAWDSDLKDQFVTYVDWLCEFLNHDIEPKRAVDDGAEDHSQFGKCVYLLARPLKWGQVRGSDLKFDGIIRKHVDEWRQAVRLTIEQLEAERDG